MAYQKNQYAIHSDIIEWSRPEDMFFGKPYKLFDKVTIDDVAQGELGDCYFLSAIAALEISKNDKRSIQN